jgi:hypothetical protein
MSTSSPIDDLVIEIPPNSITVEIDADGTPKTVPVEPETPDVPETPDPALAEREQARRERDDLVRRAEQAERTAQDRERALAAALRTPTHGGGARGLVHVAGFWVDPDGRRAGSSGLVASRVAGLFVCRRLATRDGERDAAEPVVVVRAKGPGDWSAPERDDPDAESNHPADERDAPRAAPAVARRSARQRIRLCPTSNPKRHQSTRATVGQRCSQGVASRTSPGSPTGS